MTFGTQPNKAGGAGGAECTRGPAHGKVPQTCVRCHTLVPVSPIAADLQYDRGVITDGRNR